MKRIFQFLILTFLFLGCLQGSARQISPSSNPQKNVILISWDGVQRAHLKELLGEGRLPHLQSLVEEGGIADITITEHATDTKAGHAEMLSGYPPETTGVWNNGRFRPIPKGYTVFERLEKHFSDRITTVMLTGKTRNIGGERGEPFSKAKRGMDVFDSNAAPATVVGPKALGYIEEYENDRFFFFFHFSDPDSKGHTYGENSREYEDAIMTCDEWLGRIVAALKEKGIYDKTILYVTSDHGFDEGMKSHRNAPFVFMASNRRVSSGDQKDVVPTILRNFGIDTEKILPPLPEKSLKAFPALIILM